MVSLKCAQKKIKVMLVDIQYHEANCQITYQKGVFPCHSAKISKKYTILRYNTNYWQ